MTSSAQQSPGAENPTKHSPNASPHGAVRFVGVFVVLVLLQLTAYRYAVNSPANDWYLFTVARHTTWLLDHIGYRATLENGGTNLNPTEVRAFIAGETHQTPAANLDDSTQPLTPWERWQYRARSVRQSSTPPHEFGPQVSFILRPGIQHHLQEQEAERQALTGSNAAPSDEVQALEASILALRKELTAGLQNPEKRQKQQGLYFSFNVVPACGAIEVMAIFLAAVIAFPAPWRSRAWGLLLGLTILYGVNILRLCCLALIGAFDTGGPWFTFVHEYVWQAIYVIFVVVVWLGWVEFFVQRRSP